MKIVRFFLFLVEVLVLEHNNGEFSQKFVPTKDLDEFLKTVEALEEEEKKKEKEKEKDRDIIMS